MWKLFRKYNKYNKKKKTEWPFLRTASGMDHNLKDLYTVICVYKDFFGSPFTHKTTVTGKGVKKNKILTKFVTHAMYVYF